jgi:outer membrane receptor for Fe3+-dicitrate
MRVSLLVISLGLALPYGPRADEPNVPAPAAAIAATSENAVPPTDPPVIEKTPAQLKKDAEDAKIRQYGVNGFKPEKTKAGDTVYCKREAPLGSRFETKQCRTFEQLRDEALKGKEYLEQMQHVVPPNKN